VSLDRDGYYLPWVPPQAEDGDLGDLAEEPPVTADELAVRRPPVGLSRAERRDWMLDEAGRIAQAQDRSRRNPLSRTPPRGLGRAGRRAWRQTDKAARKDWMARERAKRGAGGPGALIVAGVLAVVLLARIFLFSSADPTVQSSSDQVPVSTVTPTFAAAAPTPVGPQSALLAWFTAVCPSTPDDPQSARLARSLPLMTAAAAAAVNTAPTPPGVVWSCSNITATAGPATADQAVVYYSADITDDRGTRTRSEARTVELQNGEWLVGPLTGTAG